MKNAKNKIVVICGPTASGKSDAAIRLAKAINGEIISADSRQIYKGLNLGSGKVPKDTTSHESLITYHFEYISEGVVHHLIDVADPMEDFNVSHFKKLAEEKIEEIINRRNVPIICGGTGFWIDAVVKNVSIPEVAPDEKLREELDKKTIEELFEQLQKLDPVRAGNIDRKNKVRLVRAIEIAKALGKVPKINVTGHESLVTKYNFLHIGIDVPREILNEKIKKRLETRFGEGMIQEVTNLLKSGVGPEWLERIGLEYRWITRYLQGKIELKEMKEKLYFDIIHYAKRQMTWFKRNKNIIWMKNYEEIENAVKKFLPKKI